ncbi:hypothetical protein BAE44_0001303 [Dichanthelium oligosanthes]|uniref:Kinetochore protein NDC80 n=1 Tax=Dichanthelium oligosanthes TaxID=888268 RepID=A0A1E5WJZ6_9POAL|nr:hypothetical protein BAE44_0001303 [Dichanthelium oligosanthes]
MRRGGGGGRRLPKSSLAPSALEATPGLDSNAIPIRNLDSAFSRRDSDAASLCSSRPASSVGVGAGAGTVPNFSDRATQAAALRIVNAFLAPAVTLRGPLPSARDIQAALRHLLERVDFPPNEANFEDDLIQALRLLGCPYKITRSALKAPGTPHSWPPLLSVLHWLTIFAQYSDAEPSAGPEGPSNDLMLYTTKGYCHFLSGDDDAVDALDKEYISKARMNGEATVATVRALEKEVQELEAEVNKLTSGPSRQEALEAEKETLTADVNKFEAVVKTWRTKIDEREEALVDLEKELEAKVLDARRTAAENQELLKKVDAQAVNVRGVERMRREMQSIERDIANAENGKAALEDQGWELDAKLVTKLEELEGLAEQCNQALKKLKPAIDFQYIINSKGSCPAEMVGPGYKTVLKPALMAHAEENKRIAVSNLGESVDLQKQLQGNVKIMEEERNNISSLQAQHDEMVARLNALDREITNDDSRCTADAGRMKDELEKKKNMLISVAKEADEFLKNSEKRLQDAILKDDEETQAAANELLQLVDSIVEHKEFMEATIAQRRKDLYEAADYIASLASKTSSPSPPHT